MATISEELDQVDSSGMVIAAIEPSQAHVPEDGQTKDLNEGPLSFSQHYPLAGKYNKEHQDIPDASDYEEDESLAERLLGLTEMFPAEVRKYGYNIGSCLSTCTKGLYAFSCSATWLFFSSSAILFAPVLFELERAQMEEAQRVQQKQVLLGPNSAMTNASPPGLPLAPPVPR